MRRENLRQVSFVVSVRGRATFSNFHYVSTAAAVRTAALMMFVCIPARDNTQKYP